MQVGDSLGTLQTPAHGVGRCVVGLWVCTVQHFEQGTNRQHHDHTTAQLESLYPYNFHASGVTTSPLKTNDNNNVIPE